MLLAAPSHWTTLRFGECIPTYVWLARSTHPISLSLPFPRARALSLADNYLRALALCNVVKSSVKETKGAGAEAEGTGDGKIEGTGTAQIIQMVRGHPAVCVKRMG